MTRAHTSKTALFVSDMHVGASTALAPPIMYKSETQNEVRANKIQMKIYDAWVNCIDNLSKKPMVLGINGEPIDGGNPKNHGQQSTLPNVRDQCNTSVQLLAMIGAENIIMTRGSGYHVQIGDIPIEEFIARELRAKRYRAYSGQDHTDVDGNNNLQALTDYFAIFKVSGKVFNMTHHVGYSKLELYRTTALAREMMALKLASDKYPKADVIVRSHVHYHVRVGFTHSQGFTVPAWKLPDGHLFRQGMAGTSPDIGMVEVVIEPNGELIVRPLIEDINVKPRVLDFGN